MEQQIQKHQHRFQEKGNKIICSVCGISRLKLIPNKEGLLIGTRDDGTPYSVRKHRKAYFMPDIWKKMYDNLKGYNARLSVSVLIQTGARIEEATHIEERDIDYDRNTLVLRVTKTKARKKGEERGNPRNIPMNSKFIKALKKHFRTLPEGSQIGILSDSSLNQAMKKALIKAGVKDYYMYSVHSIRKTHGNWLKIMGDVGMMKVQATEICLRLGHDYNTFLKDYGSSGVMNPADLLLIKEILGDLYQ